MQLTSPPDNTDDASPDWAPDDSQIVFESDRTGDPKVWIMNSDGTNQRQVTFNVIDFRPAWSPDGSKIVFARDVTFEQGGIEIVVMNSDGSNKIQLTFNDVPDDDPDWQPIPRAAVGGVTSSVNRFEIITPYIVLVGLVITISTIYVINRRKD
jgi:TolB protein